MATLGTLTPGGNRGVPHWELDRMGERRALRRRRLFRVRWVMPRWAENSLSAIAHGLGFTRDLLLVLWAMTALAFCLVVMAGVL